MNILKKFSNISIKVGKVVICGKMCKSRQHHKVIVWWSVPSKIKIQAGAKLSQARLNLDQN